MSYYYKYEFVSPEPIFTIVKEELRSYFDAGIADDTFFPVWADKCLEKLGRSTYEVNNAVLNVAQHSCKLPDDFKYIREAWMCTHVDVTYQLPNSTFEQVRNISTRIDNPDFYCRKCRECEIPDVIEVVFKTNQQVMARFQRTYLLTPGNIDSGCPNDLFCANRGAASPNSYDVRDNKFVTTFKEGQVYIQYYSIHRDGSDNQLIPDTYRVKEFIEAFIKQKVFETVYNQITDETYNQSRDKYLYYKQLADEAFIEARSFLMLPDPYKVQKTINEQRHRLDRFKIR